MKVRSLVFGLAAALCVGANANAAIIIPTNNGGGDVDIREHEIATNQDSEDLITVATRQRGAVNEVATAALNTTVSATGDRSTIAYFKFDISSLPNHTADPAFWAGNQNLAFRLSVRNTSFTNSRIVYPSPPNAELYRTTFEVHALKPESVYADDVGGTTTRTDRSGNSYESPNYKYDWSEGTGTGIANDPNQNSGITWVDAPGITPFCMNQGMCNTSDYGGTANDINQSLGLFDDYNSDTELLGLWSFPSPEEISTGSNRMPVGQPLEYVDTNGNLRNLIFRAQDAGRTKVTLMLNFGLDTLLDTSSNPGGGIFDGPNPGVFPNNTFLNFSYAFNPKDMTTLNNDANYDADGPLSTDVAGSPYSCRDSANCAQGELTGDNTGGRFSPQLVLRVPEPSSMLLFLLGSIGLAAVRRQK